MPFLSFLVTVIIGAFVISFFVVVAYFEILFLIGAAGVALLLGWIPILMCVSDPGMNVGEGIVGGWALFSLWGYGLGLAAWGALLFLRPDPDGLPPALKFLANFYPTSVSKAAKTAREGSAVDLTHLASRMRASTNEKLSGFQRAFRRWQSEKATEEIESETEYQDAQTELHRAAQQFNRAKLRAEEAEKARKRNGQ